LPNPIKKEEDIFRDNPTSPKELRRSRIKIPRKISSSCSTWDPNSDEYDKIPYDKDGFRSYNLILPYVKKNKIKIDELRLAIIETNNGRYLEKRFKKMKLKPTRFDAQKGSIQEPIFEILHKRGCGPEPRGVVCVKYGFNL
jgi:hypothetical protein